jgi:choloylglycine hydrolase
MTNLKHGSGLGGQITIFRAFHILNNFDIPIGAIRENNSEDALMDCTVWTSADDTSNAIYFYKTFLTQAVESVSVRDVVKDLKEPKTLKMESAFAIKDRSGEFDS